MIPAYLVLFIDRTNAIVNARICSEPQPTCDTGLRTEVVFTQTASTYDEAAKNIRACLRDFMKDARATTLRRLART